MNVNYTKTCKLSRDLILLLRSRGLSIPDEQQAISYLTNIGYYRLSAYFYPSLKEPKITHCYKDEATFDMALRMYRFDRKLRILLFNEIEKIEVAIRSAFCYINTQLIGHNLFKFFLTFVPSDIYCL